MKTQEISKDAIKRVKEALTRRPDTIAGLVGRMDLSERQIREAVAHFRSARRIHVCAWQGQSKVWSMGRKPNAPRPVVEVQPVAFLPPQPGVVRTEWRFPIPHIHGAPP